MSSTARYSSGVQGGFGLRGDKGHPQTMFIGRAVSLLLLYVAFLFVSASACYGLDPALHLSQYAKRNWQVEEGLPHNYVMTYAPESDGYLLVGTDEGLARFDGVRFSSVRSRTESWAFETLVLAMIGISACSSPIESAFAAGTLGRLP